MTKFKWISQNKMTYPVSIKDFQPEMIKRRSFQEKAEWFRLRLEDRKVPWINGGDTIFVDRTNILTSSYEQLAKLNITKEIKVNFTDQKGQNDAGGIFREWLNLCMKEIFQNSFGMLNLCCTEETYYKFNMNDQIITQCLDTAKLLGYLIAKALMEHVPINCHLNHTIWRQLLQQRIILDDIYTYDKDFYKYWSQILSLSSPVEDLCLNFTVMVKDEMKNKNRVVNLIQNGQNIYVTKENKEEYLKKIIQFYCVKFASKAIENIKMTLYEIIPIQYLAIFQPYEIDCLLCGQDSIDLQDWRQNTVYEGYKQEDQVIEWFWKVMRELEPKMLKNMLHYCTGCSRVPVTGFKYLQSNRNEIRRFTIRKTVYESSNPYPRSYTCFNRLQLPEYTTFQQLSMRMYSVCSQEINFINKDA